MSLTSLPPEILIEIFSIAAGPQPTSAEALKTLANASLTCRYVSTYSQSALFKAVSFRVYQRLLKPEWLEANDDLGIANNGEHQIQLSTTDDAKYERELTRLGTYVRACASNRILRDTVRSLDVRWVMDLNSDLVHRHSDLESLMSNINHAADVHIKIFNHWRGPNEPSAHMYQRRPNNLMNRMCEINIQRDDSESNSEPGHCQVNTTRIECWSRPIRLEILENILSSNLGPIKLAIPLVGDSAVVNRKLTRSSSCRAFDFHEELSPMQLQRRCLDGVRGNLIDLDMDGDGIKITGGHDGSRLDLHSFDALTHIDVDGALLFGNSPSTAADADRDLSSRLPSNLKNLAIRFPRDQGVFWSLPSIRKMKSRAVRSLINRTLVNDEGRIALSWIRQLLEHKQSSPPNLETLGLYEKIVIGPWMDYTVVNWPLPAWLRQSADDCGVDMEVEIRLPKGTRLLPDWEVVGVGSMLLDQDDAALDTDHELDEYY